MELELLGRWVSSPLEDSGWFLKAVTAAADYGNGRRRLARLQYRFPLSTSLSVHSAWSLVFFLVSLGLRFCRWRFVSVLLSLRLHLASRWPWRYLIFWRVCAWGGDSFSRCTRVCEWFRCWYFLGYTCLGWLGLGLYIYFMLCYVLYFYFCTPLCNKKNQKYFNLKDFLRKIIYILKWNTLW